MQGLPLRGKAASTAPPMQQGCARTHQPEAPAVHAHHPGATPAAHTLAAHAPPLQVRDVCVCDLGLLTSSRDKTVKLWVEDGGCFTLMHTLVRAARLSGTANRARDATERCRWRGTSGRGRPSPIWRAPAARRAAGVKLSMRQGRSCGGRSPGPRMASPRQLRQPRGALLPRPLPGRPHQLCGPRHLYPRWHHTRPAQRRDRVGCETARATAGPGAAGQRSALASWRAAVGNGRGRSVQARREATRCSVARRPRLQPAMSATVRLARPTSASLDQAPLTRR
jgi:hypothetical protein